MTSATERLRAMLDERGVKYETDDTQVSETERYYVTKLRDGYSNRWVYEEPPDCDLLVSYQYDLGAEDAIAATLGSPVDTFTLDEMEDLYKDLDDECSDVMVTVDGVRYETDWGYGVEAVRYFIDMLRRRHRIEEDA